MATTTGLRRELERFAELQRGIDRAGALAGSLARGAWIYGAGGYGLEVRRLLERRGFACRGFIDRRAADPSLAERLGVRVISPDAAAAEAQGALIIGIHNFKDDISGVVAWARGLGFDPVITAGQLPDLLGPDAGSYWLTSREFPMNALDHIEALAGRLADETSVAVLAGLARFRISGDVAHHPASNLDDQYLPDLLPRFDHGVRFVDGGAFDGDTIRAFARRGIDVKDWLAFEPDLANFAALSKTAQDAQGVRATLFPCGLGETTCDIGFADGSGSGSHIEDGDGATGSIRVVALDEVAVGFAPNFVKLDVEGAECAALRGMARMLAACRPVVAVSVYHKPADLWEIPTLLDRLLGKAKLHLRQHGYNGFDTVLYAVP